MDYDDNENQCHNPPSSGEERSKTLLRPYAFPKFDFDDSLPGHLKFDNLVESEVFMGIQSEEDNQWFSGSNNVIEFSSSASESCSMSRRNNVWSEATSSESVEMLLNSVGQEEIAPGENLVEDSNNSDKLRCLTEQMDHSHNLNDKKDELVTNSIASVPQVEFLESFPRLDVRMEVPKIEATTQFQDTGENSSHLGATNDACISGNGVNQFASGEYESNSEREAGFPQGDAKFPVVEPVGGDSYDSGRLVDNFNLSSRILNTSESGKQDCNPSLENAGCILENVTYGENESTYRIEDQNEVQILEQVIVDSAGKLVQNSPQSVSNVDPGRQEDALEANPVSVEESAGNFGKDESSTYDRNVSSTNSEQPEIVDVALLSTGGEIGKQFRSNYQLRGCDDGLEQHAFQFIDDSSGKSSGSALNEEPIIQSDQNQGSNYLEDMPESSHQKESEVSANTSQPSLSSGKENEHSICRTSSNIMNTACQSSDLSVLSSPPTLITGGRQHEILEPCRVASASERDLCNDDAHCSSSVIDSPGQVCEEKIFIRKSDAGAYENNCAVIDESNCSGKSPPDNRNVDVENVETEASDQALESLSASTQIVDVDMAVHHLQLELAVTIESENEVCLPEKSLNPPAMENGHPSGAMPPLIDEHKIARGISTHASFPSLQVFPSGETEGHAVSEPENGVNGHLSGAMLSHIAEKTLSTKTDDGVSMRTPVATVSFDSCKSFLEESHARPTHPSDEAVFKDVDTGGVFAESNEDDNASAQSLDQKSACDSPTIISSKEVLQNGGNVEESSKFQSVAEDSGGKDISVDDSSFSFKVNSPPHVPRRETGSNWSPFPCSEMCNSSMVIGGALPASTTTSTPGRSRKSSDAGHKTPRDFSESKNRRAGKGSSKESKGNRVETVLDRSNTKEDKFSVTLLRPLVGSPHAKFAEVQPYGRVELNNTAVSGAVTAPTSNLPDLKSSALNHFAIPAATSHQPFTDMQQVQLRAQIFVYGSLIQGTAPDEPCMVAAFGPSDGNAGASVWEPVWRAALERVRNQKSQSSSVETPLLSCSKLYDPTAKQVSKKHRLPPSPVNQASNNVPSAVVSPTMPLSSSLWSVPTLSHDRVDRSHLQGGLVIDFQPAVCTLHPYPIPPMRNLSAPTPWPLQGPFSAAWVSATRTSTSDESAPIAPLSGSETIKMTPAKDCAGPSASGVLFATSRSTVNVGFPTTLFPEVSPLPEITNRMASGEQYSADAKPKKRKKVPTSIGLDKIPVFPESQSGLVAPSSVTTLSLSVVVSETQAEPVVSSSATPTSSLASVTTPAFLLPRIDMSKSSGDIVAISSAEMSKRFDCETGKTADSSEEISKKVAEAKLEAEKAASLAADAVSHSQGVWSQLSKQTEAGLTSEVEAKLASAAVAIAAAASVAKAATASAEIAFNAALQAKLMADEAFISLNTIKPTKSSIISFTDVNSMVNVTPASILKADGGSMESSSILVAAKEATRKRLEAASAAAKQAEILDAIVKAAELAAEAVSQAGRIVAMGNPLPLSELVRAGPYHYWKSCPSSPRLAVDMNNKNRGEIIAKNDEASFIKVSGKGFPYERDVNGVTHEEPTHVGLSSNDMLGDSYRLMDDTKPSIPVHEQDRSQLKALEVPKSNEMFPQLECGTVSCVVHNEQDDRMDMLHNNTIKPGCTVEVLKDGKGFKPGWFSARALTLDNDNAFVSYEDLLAEDGQGNLKEWVNLEGNDDKAPIIRVPYPPSRFQGGKKRRWADIWDYAWAVGDKVDAYIDHCWCEGLLTEKNEKDKSSFTVHFPAHGETTVVRAWQLRPSRTWSDGKWIVWPSLEKYKPLHSGDTPREKRQKLAASCIDSAGTDKLSYDCSIDTGKPTESNPLALSASYKVFNVGRSSSEENKHAQRTLRTGLQKEGSTIYGLPNLGKKQKFMEVSKHFLADRNCRTKKVNDSVKSLKYSMPQAKISHGLRNASKFGSKEIQETESKSKAPGTRRRHNVSSRMSRKDNLANPSSDLHDETMTGHGTDTMDSVEHKNVVEKTLVEHHSSPGTEASESLLSDHLDMSSTEVCSSNSQSDQLSRKRLAPSGGWLTKIDEGKTYDGSFTKYAADVIEPRRSNRRIQPTHRLLEGLQSSMRISKLPPISHEKGPRSQSRSSTTIAK